MGFGPGARGHRKADEQRLGLDADARLRQGLGRFRYPRHDRRALPASHSDTIGYQIPTNVAFAGRLRKHDTLIADRFNSRVIRIDRGGNIEWQYGTLNVAGNGPDQLNAPYSAMVIGDYTAVTSPLFFSF